MTAAKRIPKGTWPISSGLKRIDSYFGSETVGPGNDALGKLGHRSGFLFPQAPAIWCKVTPWCKVTNPPLQGHCELVIKIFYKVV